MAAPTHKALYELLSGITDVTDIGHRRIRQQKAKPYISHFKVSGPPSYSKDGDEGIDVERHQVNITASDDDTCQSIAEQVRSALNGYSGTVSVDSGVSSVIIDSIRLEDENDGLDEPDNAVRIIQDYIIRRKR